MFSRSDRASNNRRRASSESRAERLGALSETIDSRRKPAIDLQMHDDVAVLTCIELSKSLLARPDVSTGSFIKLVGASKSDVNKSDAVLVITAAILESINNKKAATDILNKSKTVSEYYRAMNLNNEKLRKSFVVMLFALAPEFVKMIEGSLINSLQRVQSITSAPHAESKMAIAMGELLLDGHITNRESNNFMKQMDNLNITDKSSSSADSIMKTPRSYIAVDDSISNAGKVKTSETKHEMSTTGMMRYIKNNPSNVSKNFYDNFPNAKKPVEASSYKGRSGLGFKSNDSVIMDNITESNFTTVLNNMFDSVPRKKRHSLTEEEKKLYGGSTIASRRAKTFKKASVSDDRPDLASIVASDNLVTRDDIDKKKADSIIEVDRASAYISAVGPTDDDSYLLDLI